MNFGKPTTKDELLEVLKEIDDYYRYRKGEYEEPEMLALDLQYMESAESGESELRAAAQALAELRRTAESTAAQNEYDADLARSNAEKAAAGGDIDKTIAQIEAAYDESAKKLTADAAARNMSVSSAYLEAKVKLEAARNAAIAEANASAKARAAQYEGKIAAAELRLSRLDAEMAAKYAAAAEEIYRELLEKRNAYRDEVLKYNNGIKEKMTKSVNSINQSKGSLRIDYLGLVYKGLTEDELDDLGYYADTMTACDAYYYSLGADEAFADFSNDARMPHYLGKYYQDVLYKYRLRKTDP